MGNDYYDEPKIKIVTQDDERLMAMLIYLSSLFTSFIGPLVIWMMKRDESDFVDFHGKEYINFLITYTIYFAVAGLSMIVLIGFILLPLLGAMLFIFTIMAAIKAYGGAMWRIPLIIRFIKY